MAKTYKNIGTYKKPSNEQIEKYPNQTQRAFIKVYMGKDASGVMLNNGDILSFTKKEDKLKELAEKLKNGNMAQDKYDYFVDQYNNVDVLAEVVLVKEV